MVRPVVTLSPRLSPPPSSASRLPSPPFPPPVKALEAAAELGRARRPLLPSLLLPACPLSAAIAEEKRRGEETYMRVPQFFYF